MRYTSLLLFLVALTSSAAPPLTISYKDCSFLLPGDFLKNENSEYFYSIGNGFNFKSISISDSEDPISFIDSASDIKLLKIYKASKFYVLSYTLLVEQGAQLAEDGVRFTLLWSKDKSISFTGFSADDVKLMANGCSSNWQALRKEEFLSLVSSQ